MSYDIIISDDDFEGKDECYASFYVCPCCKGYCLMEDFKFCPHCGGSLVWNITDKHEDPPRHYHRKTFKDGTGW